MNILDAMRDEKLFAPWFKNRDTWSAWFAFLAALFALPMTPDQLAVYRKCTSRTEAPKTVAQEAWLVCGRRAGKSFVLGLVAVFLACFHEYRKFLAFGERGTVLVIATDRKQARVIFRYIRGLLSLPMLKRMVERETSDAFDLNNHVSIEVSTASFRSTRGYTIVAALLDELAFWPTDDAAAPDVEVIAALRPGMSTIPTSMLLCASSPYARRGALWDTYRAHFGRDGDPILVWHASTTAMNPTVRQAVIDKAIELDPSRAAAEYLAQFRTDVETFIAREVVEAAIAPGRYELPPVAGTRYVAFTDPSGGSGDAMTLGIAHLDRASKHIVLDALRWVMPPFSPDTVVKQFAELLKSYGVHKVTGDRYGGEWPRERFRVCGIAYEVADKPKSDIYGALLPLLNSGRAELLDQPRLVSQLCALERRTARSGRDIIDHPPHAHDDIANAVAGALVAADAKRQMVVSQTAVEHASMPTPYSLRRSRRTLTPLEARDRQRFY